MRTLDFILLQFEQLDNILQVQYCKTIQVTGIYKKDNLVPNFILM